MSLSKKYLAPNILGPMDFMGLSNEIILIEYLNNPLDQLENVFKDKNNIIFSSERHDKHWPYSAFAQVESITRIYQVLKSLQEPMDFIIIDSIDQIDYQLGKKQRGSNIKAYLSMIASKKILKGANLIITSGKSEYSIREIANQTHTY